MSEQPLVLVSATIPMEALVCLWTFGGLLICAILREINKRTGFPYTPMVVFAGLFMGVIVTPFGVVGKSLLNIQLITPVGILMIFIPTLIFESAFNSDWYIFKREKWQMIILAGPGVALGAGLIACSIKFLLFYTELSWPAALMMGSIISTTDTVAVIALLKELGVSTRFNTVIEGESLFNDGTGMVFFLLFSNILKGEDPTVTDAVLDFAKLVVGGPIFGLIMAFLTSLWLHKIVRDEVLTSSLLFVSCYLTFYIAEFIFHTSGILAVVALGLFMSAFGRVKINPEAVHAVHTVWSFVQYSLESLVFLLTGIIIGYQIIYSPASEIGFTDWVRMPLLYLCMMGARFIMILSFWPLLNRVGYVFTLGEVLVMGYGGLRGALGLCLALMAHADPGIEDERIKQLTLFHMAGMAVMTLLVNGLTAGAIVRKLGIIANPPIKRKIFRSFMKSMILESEHKIKELQNDPFFTVADWKKVIELAGEETMVKAAVQDENVVTLDALKKKKSSYAGYQLVDILGEIRYRMLKILKGIFWEKYEEGECLGDSAHLLAETCDWILEETERPIDIWTSIYSYFTDLGTFRLLFKFTTVPFLGGYATRYVNNHLAFIYDVVTLFIIALDEVIEHEKEIPLEETYISQVTEELATNRRQAENYIHSLNENFPEFISAVQSKRAAVLVLNNQKVRLQKNYHSGNIDSKEYHKIRVGIDDRMYEVTNFQPPLTEITFNSMIVNFPIFKCLTNEESRALLNATKEKKFKEGEMIFEKGKTCEGLYVLSKGLVDEVVTSQHAYGRGIGSVLSYINIMGSGKWTNKISCKAKTDGVANLISAETIKPILKKNSKFRALCTRNAFPYLVRLNIDKSKPLSDLDDRELNAISFAAKYKVLKKKDKPAFPHGGFVFSGEVIVDEKTYTDYMAIPASSSQATWNPIKGKETSVMIFAAPASRHSHGHGKSHKLSSQKGSVHHQARKLSTLNVVMEKEKEIDEEFEKRVQGKTGLLDVPVPKGDTKLKVGKKKEKEKDVEDEQEEEEDEEEGENESEDENQSGSDEERKNKH